ncbi:helix-turn-helix domain-containing protein [Actinomadura parmotrematis]|uniref:Helix-turn-helix domain-containing protein n=1 Tax=Actinomadura parmotrematis TaxID=2864039 RepID=A0ABS7G277_9ACTN|nr:helix-turn-helix domain-containing protein [Actinomadura parmotrematis]MBW8486814.1 helix-turn-helix domain-containing protein [Actinomadura parmotrematis]
MDRFDWFTEVVSRSLMPSAFSPLGDGGFHAEGASLDLGAVQVSRFVYSPLRSRRTARLIRQGDPEQYQLGLVTAGTAWFAQDGGEAALRPRDMALWDTSRPYESGSGMDGRDVEVLVLQIPKARMPLPARHVDGLLARRLPGGAGLEAILAGFLVSLAGDGPAVGAGGLGALGDMAVELAAACLAQRAGGDGGPASPEVRAHLLLARIDAFIDRRLGDPDLTPRLVADHHHVSLRTLYALFEERQEGVAATIRRRRLERCRADLASPALRHRSVQDVAARWGFASATAFSRAFRAAYGVAPSEHRRRALRLDGGWTG